jgi:phosphoglycerol transferase MdoB-like AlkP superfamily enzyme
MDKSMEYIFHFVIGGGIIAAIVYLTDNLDTRYAALAYAFPISLSIALVITYFKHDLETVSGLAKHSVLGLILTIGFAVIFAILAPRIGFWGSFILASISFCGGGLLFLRYI